MDQDLAPGDRNPCLEFGTSMGNGAGRRMPGGHLGRGEEADTEAYLGYQENPDPRLWT